VSALSRARDTLRRFVLWILPVSAFVATTVGSSHPFAIKATVALSVAALALLFYHPLLARLGSRTLDWLTGPSVIRKDLNVLATALQESRDETRVSLQRLEQQFAVGLVSVSKRAEATAEVALYGARWTLGARALFIDRMSRPVYFIHSHRPEESTHRRTEQLDEPRFTMPPVPVDEADFIPMTTQWVLHSGTWVSSAEAMSAPSEIQVLCGCTVESNDPILVCDLVLIGSTIYNRATNTIQKAALSKKWLGYEFCIDEHTTQGGQSAPERTTFIQGVPSGPYCDDVFRPDPEIPSRQGERLIDYGLLTRMPNPLAPYDRGQASFVVIAGGCLLAGQVALTEWLARPATLHQLSVEFEDRPCQYIIQVKYVYQSEWRPIVDKESVRIVAKAALSMPMPS
jgi:hypothetical protein